MRRTAARIGVVATLALSMGVATAVAPPAHADEPTDGLISSPRANDDEMNYAINLAPGASASDLERAIGLVPSVQGRGPWPRTPRSAPSSLRAPTALVRRPTWPPR